MEILETMYKINFSSDILVPFLICSIDLDIVKVHKLLLTIREVHSICCGP